MATLIQLRRDTSLNWITINPVLALGEMGIETDTNKAKVGDGVTAWLALGYTIDPALVQQALDTANTALAAAESNTGATVVSLPSVTGTTNPAAGVSSTYTATATSLLVGGSIASFTFVFDGNAPVTVNAISGSASASYSWTGTVGQTKTLEVYATDNAGNQSQVKSITVTITAISIATPTINVTGSPSSVPQSPTITTSAFIVNNGTDTHASTDWEVRRSSDNVLVWSSYSNTTNKLSISVPSGLLQVNTTYIFKAKHNGTTYTNGSYGSISATTALTFSSIGTPGSQGFGVGIYPGNDLAAYGIAELPGTTTLGSDNYGNYIHSATSSIMAFVPKFYYRIGNSSAPKFGTYGANTVEVKDASAYANEATANADGWILHRAFIDGGVEKSGFFIDKYINSKRGTTAGASIKNGVPISLTTNTQYTNSTGMNNCTGILADAVYLARQRGTGFNVMSVFQMGAIAMLQIAHAQNATSSTYCAWYDASGATNFPKGCNNSALADINDSSVVYTTADDSATSAKPKTGSASNFAKTTHNGQNNGVADLNGSMWQVVLGMTAPGTNATDTAQNSTNTTYILKRSVALSSLTGDWNTSTSAWGDSSNLASKYDSVTSPITINTNSGVYWGNGSIGVFTTTVNAATNQFDGFLPSTDSGHSSSGTNQFGTDYLHKYNRANQFVLCSGSWDNSSIAGLFLRHLYYYRSYGGGNVSFRSSLYLL